MENFWGSLRAIHFFLAFAVAMAAVGAYIWFRFRQAVTKLGKVSNVLTIRSEKDIKNERILWVLAAVVTVAGIVRAVVTSAEAAITTLSQALFITGLNGVQRAVREFRFGENGLVYAADFIPWNKVESIVWDNDVNQQIFGVLIKYIGNNRQKSLRIWLPREKKQECAELFEMYWSLTIRQHQAS